MSSGATGQGGGEAFEADAVQVGVEAAVERARRWGLEVPDADLVVGAVDRLHEVVDAQAASWPPRAIELFSETTAIAGIARATYGHDPLHQAQIAEFVDAFQRYVNSWCHWE